MASASSTPAEHPAWVRVEVEVDGLGDPAGIADLVDLASGDLWAAGAAGIEEVARGGRTRLVATAPESAAGALRAAAERHGEVRVSVVAAPALDQRASWREPVVVGRVAVVPEVLDVERGTSPAAGGAPIVVSLDPGEAFGTGTHASTRLALDVMQHLDLAGREVLDVGCGTGVLSVVAARLGARTVTAIDVDPAALEVARANAERNGVAGLVDVRGEAIDQLDRHFDVVVANLTAATLVDLAPALERCAHPNGGMVVVSGVLVDQVALVERAFARQVVDRRVDGEWTALALQ